MKKSLFVSVISIFLISFNFITAQNSNSIQVNGGIIMPSSSSNGINTSVQYNYVINNKIQIYAYIGYSSWDRYNVKYIEEGSWIQNTTIFNSYSSDDHVLIPIYLGGRFDLHTNKLFTAFAIFEIGYSHLSYYNYKINKEIDPVTGVVLGYNADRYTKTEMNENLVGLGTGVGLSHQIMENMNIVLSFKINSHLNSNYYGFLSNKGTYTAANLGLNVGI